MKFRVTWHWLKLANQWLQVTRQFLWLDSSCDSTLTRLDQSMTLTRLEKNLDDSDSRGLWLWLDKNDSDTSLLNVTIKMWKEMAYYIPTVWKSGGTRPPCLPPNAPMLTTGSESTKNRSSSSPFTRSSCNNKSGTSEWIASVCGEYTVLYGFNFWKFIKINWNNSSVLGYLALLILYVPPLMKNKKLAARKHDRVFTKRQVIVKKERNNFKETSGLA